ncbi:D-alanyl-D-alanine carboxypeptidase [Alicyclobacillus tolerans]|uniref:D-alanyl-D-alanine carboxypeptidase family protein n=1 Tax=Alicyclobacillus tolerans TaxID=90970 RepID=UPI001F43B843|nr:D-alanyl-D-alanine carboxypeptidase family protein [Alicyclobacillus tolerans]MCF8563673.1 D-alanyl-D-alanine carboxypeptidase [Alicyclobacillus tolerans]
MMWHKGDALKAAALLSVLTLLAPQHTFAAEISSMGDPASGVRMEVHPPYSLGSPYAVPSVNQDQALAKNARSAVLMDYATGKVLFEKDAHEKLPMASITKVMTLLLIMEAIDDGKIKMTDRVKTSDYAASMGGSQIFLEPGETMTVHDMLKGIAIASANDACVAMAEQLAGSEENFVARMNARAKQLGMDDTHFVNCNGLPAPNHYSSAHDIAIMSRELLNHEEVTKFTSVYSDYLRKDTDHPLWLVNTNKLVRFYDGVDGLKTGYTAEAKYCLSATAKKDGFRVIAVVMGEPKPPVRNAEVSQMLNWTFSQYTSKVLYKEGQIVSEAKVSHGVPEKLAVKAGDTVGIIQEKGKKVEYETKVNLFHLNAPIKENQRVGTLQVYEDDDLVAEVPLLATRSIQRAGFFQSIGRTIRDMVTFGNND